VTRSEVGVQQPTQLRILMLLSGVHQADFNFLLTALSLTEEELSSHMSELASAEYVAVSKPPDGELRRTSYSMTDLGRSQAEWLAPGQYDHRAPAHRPDEVSDSVADPVNGNARQERLADIGQMASSVIHDLRGSMGVIRGALPVLISEDASDGEKRQFARMVDRNVERMVAMTREVLEYARGEAAAPKLDTIDAAEFVDFVAESLRHSADLSGLKLRTRARTSAAIHVDRERLARAFYNIAGNAADAMGDEGTFTISAESRNGHVRFVLADTGPGIPDEIADRLFEPFVTTGKTHGTGLGLTIARDIVRAHEGEIHVESRPGRGTTFFIDLPVATNGHGAPTRDMREEIVR
jgi:signal transduction histidine kinase